MGEETARETAIERTARAISRRSTCDAEAIEHDENRREFRNGYTV
jgi:hypothetical protein